MILEGEQSATKFLERMKSRVNPLAHTQILMQRLVVGHLLFHVSIGTLFNSHFGTLVRLKPQRVLATLRVARVNQEALQKLEERGFHLATSRYNTELNIIRDSTPSPRGRTLPPNPQSKHRSTIAVPFTSKHVRHTPRLK